MSRFEEIIEDRRKKLKELRDQGVNPYPAKVPKSIPIAEVASQFSALVKGAKSVVIHGRVLGIRKQGGLIFLDAFENGARMQIFIRKNNIKNFSLIKRAVDIGDFVSIKGKPFFTKTKEKTLEAYEIEIIAKSLRPLPDTWYGLKDTEERYRRRYLDFLFNEEAKSVIEKRSLITLKLREIISEYGFVEVETPILQAIAGGATARPFETHSNALDMDLYLRVAPELFLKRMIVAGWEKVFEIGKDFRNEGIDREHNPEFTMLELYWAYQEYGGLMKFIEEVLVKLLKVTGIKNVTYNNKKLSWKKPWPRISFADVIKRYTKLDVHKATEAELRSYLKKNKITFDKKLTKYELADEIFKKKVRPLVIDPIFVINLPKEISPLAKSSPDNPRETERFQLVVAGMEVVNGFSELNDPVDQRERMEQQEELYRSGHVEVSRLDEDYIEALEFGMPPAAGLGMGIDRLVTILTNSQSLRDVIAFPLLKPKEDR